MLLPALIGAVCGLVIVWLMYREGMLAERSGAAMLLAAVALFYPVFAASEGDWLGFSLHLVIFGAFVVIALLGYRQGLFLLAGGLIAHGIFDIAAGSMHTPGPTWWPAFCAGLDIAAGGVMIRLIQTGKIAR